MIVLVGGEKGGVGKTTLAVNLAAMRARAGHDVLLVDADKQASANLWASIRDQEKVDPPVRCVQKRGKGLATDVRDLATRYEDIVIDAGGQDSVELRAAMTIAALAIFRFSLRSLMPPRLKRLPSLWPKHKPSIPGWWQGSSSTALRPTRV